ncbi:SH3 domain-containing protein [Amphritea sp. HPY]|uniref:SH3 domain-containing protein n=1 Tax=Amphritea sp. HPY TaxID=3421652 RepID=UPI003D7F164B
MISGIASAFEYYSVNRDTLVLSMPSVNGTVVAPLARGQVLLQIDEQGDWSKVFFLSPEKQPLKGWLLSNTINAQAKVRAGTGANSTDYFSSSVDKLRLRMGPGADFEVLGTLSRKQVVKRLHSEGDWAKIRYRTASGSAAQSWVAAAYLKPVTSPADFKQQSVTASVNQTANLYRVTGSKVNFRQGPDTSFPVIGQLNRDQQVKIIAEQGEWKKIRYDLLGKELSGWMVGRFLKPK